MTTIKKIIFALSLAGFLFPSVVAAASIKTTFNTLVADVGIPSGAQSMCVKDASGAFLVHNADMRIIPASVTKIYVTDMALSTLPMDFRYETTFIQKGNTLYINGGGDPHFVIEHLEEVLKQSFAEQKQTIKTIVVGPQVYFNWKTAPKEVRSAMVQSLSGRSITGVDKKVVVRLSDTPYKGSGVRYVFYSAPLPKLLKQINEYSTNISAEILFQKIGGSEGLSAYLKKTYGVGKETAFFTTGSGLSGNYTTCSLTVRVLEHLTQTLNEKGMLPTEVLSVPVLDHGVLSNRSIDTKYAKALVAKSGFVNEHHTLAGVINTNKGFTYFGIFTDYPHPTKSVATKSMIDTFVSAMLKEYRRALVSFNYERGEAVPTGYKIVRK